MSKSFPSIRNRALKFSGLTLACLLGACSFVQEQKVTEPITFKEESFSDLPRIAPKDWQSALNALQNSCRALGSHNAWREVCAKAYLDTPENAFQFFSSNFTLWQATLTHSPKKPGFMTGYYEPELRGSLKREGPFQYPLYQTPPDLLTIDLGDLYPSLKGLRLRGRVDGQKVVPYYDRKEITHRTDMDPFAIVWVDDPVDAFFLHIQGSGRIRLPDDSHLRLGFDNQNGYQYRSVSQWLVKNSDLKPYQMSMQRIRTWAKHNPKRVNEMLSENPSYIFFKERLGASEEGPIGAQGVPLTPQASVAVDPAFWRYGTPFIVDVTQESPNLHYVRPVIAQDTGGAIKGALRFDYFWGFGDKAGLQAGTQKSAVKAWVMAPKGLNPKELLR